MNQYSDERGLSTGREHVGNVYDLAYYNGLDRRKPMLTAPRSRLSLEERQ